MSLPDFSPLIAGVNPGYLLRMTSIRSADATSGKSRLWTALVLLWLAGIGLRLTLLAVPPVIPLIHRDLDLSETAIGTLSTLPSLLLAAAAVPGSLLIARFGAKAALVLGLLLVGFGSAARGLAGEVIVLYLTTIVMSAGVAIMQPALPPLVRDWLPDRIGLATAVYANGLLLGETIAVGLTIPVVLPLVDGSWRLSFVVWGVPVVLTALLVIAFSPRAIAPTGAGSAEHLRRWWPDWRDPMIWRLALLLGCVNTDYFATNTFLPDYLHATDRADIVSSALTSINMSQLPASFLMLAFTGRIALHRWPYVAAGLVNLASVVGMMAMPGGWIVFWAGLLGFSNAVGLILILALPPMLSRADDVHRMAAAMFTISYPCAVAMSVVGGFAWDMTGLPAIAFVPIGICAFGLAALPLTIDFRRPAD
jgi:CP family cyanate transporter-like MFS transporter